MLVTPDATMRLGARDTIAPVSVKDRVHEVLRRTGWSQRELARQSGLAGSHISLILNSLGENVRVDTLRAIAAAAKVSEAWMITGAGTPDGPDAPAADGHSTSPEGFDVACFAALPNWRELLASARLLRPQLPDGVWLSLGTAHPLIAGPASPGMLAELADVLHRFGSPPQGRRLSRTTKE